MLSKEEANYYAKNSLNSMKNTRLYKELDSTIRLAVSQGLYNTVLLIDNTYNENENQFLTLINYLKLLGYKISISQFGKGNDYPYYLNKISKIYIDWK